MGEWREGVQRLYEHHKDPDEWVEAREIDAREFYDTCTTIGRRDRDEEPSPAELAAVAMALQLGFEVARRRYDLPL